ncbi:MULTISPECIES: beta/gamma crystallin-related protein [Phenylobacterium]|uniref:Beta/gamma crystallin 'Greek key' domain-containing protein n=1 Tax=Phenylobacterium koreense TaxID=266125 RepID=A0ABV2EG71_9CAUL
MRLGILMACGALAAAAGPSLAQDRMAANAQFFSGTNFTGRTLTVTGSMPIFLATWAPRSVRVGGGSAWEVCEQRAFRGRCTVISGASSNLQAQLGVSGVGSVRPAPARPVPPLPPQSGHGVSLRGMAAEFFPAPHVRGQRVEACAREGGTAACIAREADTFCRSIGYVRARNSAAETVGGRIFLADVLCSKWN